MANEPTTQPVITSIEGAVLAVKLDNLKEQMSGILSVMEKMQTTIQGLADVQRQQRDFHNALDRAFSEIKEQRERFDKFKTDLEKELPGLRAIRKWAIGIATTGAGMLGVALITLLLINPLYRGYGQQPPSQTFIVPQQPEHTVKP